MQAAKIQSVEHEEATGASSNAWKLGESEEV